MTILDIGASTGEGTTSILRAVNPKARIFAVELDPGRYKDLEEKFKDDNKTFLFKGSSCPAEHLMSEQELNEYLMKYPGWNCWREIGPNEMFKWRDNQENMIKGIKTKSGKDLIPYIKKKHNVEHFDMVIVDGSPFTAWYEIEQTHGAKTIVLDDINDPKNAKAYRKLAGGGDYWCVEVNKHRQGFAIFEKLG